MRISPWLVAACVLATGCLKIDYVNGSAAGSPVDDGRQLFLISGLISMGDPVRVDQVCPSGFSRVYTEEDIVDFLISSVSGNCVGTRTYEVYCNGGTAYLLEVDDAGLVKAIEPLEG